VSEQPVVIDNKPTVPDMSDNNDAAQSDATMVDAVESDVAQINDTVNGREQAFSKGPGVQQVAKRNALFGGSASTMTLLALFSLCLIRVGRSKAVKGILLQ